MHDDAAIASALVPVPAFVPAAALVPAAEPDQSSNADGFDRARVLDLVALLERDIALVEQAMTSLEAGEHRSAESALSVLESVEPAMPAEAGSVSG